MRIATVLLFLFAAVSLRSAEPDAEARLLRWMDRIAQRHLDQRALEIAGVKTVDAAERRQKQVREKILELIGGLPDYAGPLNAKVTGRIEKPDYIIENVVFESLPRLWITANLSRPRAPGRYPGILNFARALGPGETRGAIDRGQLRPQRLRRARLRSYVRRRAHPVFLRATGEASAVGDPPAIQLAGRARRRSYRRAHLPLLCLGRDARHRLPSARARISTRSASAPPAVPAAALSPPTSRRSIRA